MFSRHFEFFKTEFDRKSLNNFKTTYTSVGNIKTWSLNYSKKLFTGKFFSLFNYTVGCFLTWTQINIYYCFLLNYRLTGREPLVLLPGPFSNEAPSGKAHLKQCEQMSLTRRQKRMCRREPGLAETLRESVRLGQLECRYQFRNERWNCTLDGRGSLLKRGESAFWF